MKIYSYTLRLVPTDDNDFKVTTSVDVIEGVKRTERGWVKREGAHTFTQYPKTPQCWLSMGVRLATVASTTQIPDYVKILCECLYSRIVDEWDESARAYTTMLTHLRETI